MTRNRSGMTGAERTALDRRANGPTGTGDVKPWGRWATLGLGVIALLGGFSGIGGGRFYGTGYYGGGGLGLIIVILLILVLMGRI